MSVAERIAIWIGIAISNIPLVVKILRWLLDLVGLSTAPENIMSLIAKLEQMPLWLAMFMAFAAWSIYFLAPPLRQKYLSNIKVNYKYWDEIDPLRVFDAAHLWVEEEPLKLKDGPSQKANPMHQFIHNQIDNGNLLIAREIMGPTGMTRWVARTSLEALAIRRNERPKFLFKEDR